MKNIIKLFLLIIFFHGVSNGTTINGKSSLEDNNDNFYVVKLQINTDTGTDKMGGATIVIKYDTTQLFFPDYPVGGNDYKFHNFSSGTYSTAIVTKVMGNTLWLNIELESDNQGYVVAGNGNWTDVATLYFTKRVQLPSEALSWETGSGFWSIYNDDNSSNWVTGEFNNNPTGVENQVAALPENFELLQNYPNPFNPSTTISFNLKSGGDVNMTVYNILGELVETLINSGMSAGNYKVKFDASNISSGVYFYRLTVDNSFTEIKKMVLLR